MIYETGLPGEPAEPHIFHHVQARYLVQFLVHHGDAMIMGMPGIVDMDFLAFKGNAAPVFFVYTEQAFHQGAFARTVLVHERMDLPGPQLELGMIQGFHAGKLFIDINHFQ